MNNINYFKKIITPTELFEKLPIDTNIVNFIEESRKEICNIINKKNNRKILIVGPCSIHNINEAKEYASRLKKLSDNVNGKILIIMRVYFEKPRTINGWKGLINDPNLDETFDINNGLYLARELLIYLANIKLPTACEILDTLTPMYISDLIAWSAIGARTTESQVHRQMVSGLSMPVGFKNSTDGNIKIATDAIQSANCSHYFYGMNYNGEATIISTKGNNNCHLILRGSNESPNYYIDNNNKTKSFFKKILLDVKIMIDCSHGNSNKDYRNQSKVWDYIIDNYLDDNSVFGYMLESNINEGNQTLENPKKLLYGVSITDSCISFKKTSEMIYKMYDLLR